MKRRLAATLRPLAGLVFWILLLVAGAQGLGSTELGRSLTRRVAGHVLDRPRVVEVVFPASAKLVAGAPVRIDVEDELVQIGELVDQRTTDDGRIARLRLYPDFAHEARFGGRFLAHRTSGDIGWILQTLLPAEMRERMRAIFLERWDREHERLLRELEPGLARLLDDLAAALRDDLDRVIRERDASFRTLGEILVEKGWEGPVEDALRDEAWPRLRARATPLIAEVGDEMIAAFPVGSTAWDLVVDKLPFSEERRVRERLRRFADEHAIPILERREPEFRKLALEVLRESARDPRMKRAVGEAAERIAGDERFRGALLDILRAWIVDNEQVVRIVRGVWDRDDLRRPLLDFLRRFEPDVHRLANEIVLDDRREGIDPELARVLRRKILRDDEDWLLFEPAREVGAEGPHFLGLDGGIR